MNGEVAARLVTRMQATPSPKLAKLRDFVQGGPSARKRMAEVRSVESLVADGADPLHAGYTNAQNYLSVFSELAAGLPELDAWGTVVAKAEETYLPGWPPMSPVSGSFFNCWALLDLPVGPTGETICSCALEIGRELGNAAPFLLTLEHMGRSAMGIYRRLDWRGDVVGLRDILDGRTYSCIVPSGYRGRVDELWYARLLPPPSDGLDHGVAFTSPYVLLGTTEADWLAFFERQERRLPPPRPGEDGMLRRQALLKRGPEPNYWNEFVFLAYHDASDSAIMLRGIPDQPRSLPHAKPAGR